MGFWNRNAAWIGVVVVACATSASYGQIQVAKLVSGDGAGYSQFGVTVDVFGDTAVVGAQDTGLVGAESGAAYVFQRDEGGPGAWGLVKRLEPSSAAALNHFGSSVSINADTIIVGARSEDSSAGAAYVFERDAGGPDNWGEVRRVTASDRASGDSFGWSTAIEGDLLVVGATQGGPGASGPGAAYVFVRDLGGADNWGEVRKIVSSDGAPVDYFGSDVAISGDTIVVGAYADDDVFNLSGSAYVFDRNEGGTDNWGQVKKLTASTPNEYQYFGRAVDIDGSDVIIGAFGDDDQGASAGAAFVFGRDVGGPGNWGEVKKLLPSGGVAGAQFGIGVAIEGSVAAVGAWFAPNAGLTYLFGRDQGGAGQWGQRSALQSGDPDLNDAFGSSVALSGDLLLVGAYQDDQGGASAGAAYVFQGVLGAALQGDCNGNGQNDLFDIVSGTSADCNDNLIPDECDIASGFSADADADGVPDECYAPPCTPGDLDGDGDVDVLDFAIFAPAFGSTCGP